MPDERNVNLFSFLLSFFSPSQDRVLACFFFFLFFLCFYILCVSVKTTVDEMWVKWTGFRVEDRTQQFSETFHRSETSPEKITTQPSHNEKAPTDWCQLIRLMCHSAWCFLKKSLVNSLNHVFLFLINILGGLSDSQMDLIIDEGNQNVADKTSVEKNKIGFL